MPKDTCENCDDTLKTLEEMKAGYEEAIELSGQEMLALQAELTKACDTLAAMTMAFDNASNEGAVMSAYLITAHPETAAEITHEFGIEFPPGDKSKPLPTAPKWSICVVWNYPHGHFGRRYGMETCDSYQEALKVARSRESMGDDDVRIYDLVWRPVLGNKEGN